MGWLRRFLDSNIGLKILMALTGLMLVGFVLVHMLGNLQIFLGADAFNEYAATMQGSPKIVWAARAGLLAAVLAHIYSAAKLTLRSRAARPQGYKEHHWLSGSYAVRTMRFGGIVLLAFIIYHLLHFTVGVVHSDFQHCATVKEQFTCYAFENVVGGFRNPLVGLFYIVAQLCLGLHLAHGVWSMCRTLGLGNPRFDGLARKIAIAIATAVTVGNISIPVAVMAGLVG